MAIISREIMKNDTNGSNIKAASKIIVWNTAINLFNRAKKVTNLKEGEGFSFAMKFKNEYFFEAKDDFALERLKKNLNIFTNRFNLISVVITQEQLMN